MKYLHQNNPRILQIKKIIKHEHPLAEVSHFPSSIVESEARHVNECIHKQTRVGGKAVQDISQQRLRSQLCHTSYVALNQPDGLIFNSVQMPKETENHLKGWTKHLNKLRLSHLLVYFGKELANPGGEGKL